MSVETHKLSIIEMVAATQDAQILEYIYGILLGSKNGQKNPKAPNRTFGFGKGTFGYVSPDFDETPEGFEGYMVAEP